MSTLGAQRVRKVTVQVLAAGMWWAGGELEGGAVPSGKLTLTLLDQAFLGTVVPTQTGLDAPDLPSFTIWGGFGWFTQLPAPPPSWQTDNGVPLQTVLGRLAQLAGETLGTGAQAPPSGLLSPSWALSAGSCKAALDQLVRRGTVPPWWVDPATGVTRFDARPGADVTSRGPITRRNMRRPVWDVGLSTVASAFLPGCQIEGVTIARTVLHEESGAARAEAWAA